MTISVPFTLGICRDSVAARQGFRTVAVNRGGRDKEPLARSLGRADYIDSERSDPRGTAALGGATAIIATVTSAEAMQAIVGGLV